MKDWIRLRRLFAFFLLSAVTSTLALSQSSKATLSGIVKDSSGAILQGARIDLEPVAQPSVSNGQGEYFLNDLAPGTYAVKVTYVGFDTYTTSVTLTPGQVAHLDVTMKVAANTQQVQVYAGRQYGEAEAINRTLAADNILQVLPAEVITSLPNANIADALGRMPSVTIERDEGEGKYVQIRGTEPRLSNTMVDGVTIPSPESGVRQIKLDTIASDLVESVEINKTLQANIDGDGIGGSVNLVTKTASDEPTITLYGVVGHTPIIGGRTVDQGGGTIGKRFGAGKRLGVLIGGTYDYNGRGINDIEPVPTTSSLAPHYDSQDFRDYIYNRTRWGGTGSVDYKLNNSSNIGGRFLFSTFRNWGNKWVFTLNDGSTPGFGMDWRRPNMAIFSFALKGSHVFGANTILWTAAVSRSRSLSGSGSANFAWIGDQSIPCTNDQSRATSVNRPGWSTGCFGTGADNAFDKNNYGFTEYDPPTFGQSVQLDLTGSASYSHLFHIGHRYDTFEFGAKVRNGHKFDDTYNEAYLASDQSGVSTPVAAHPEWNSNFTDPDYYDGTYGKYPAVVDFGQLKNYALTTGAFTLNGGPGVNANNYDLIERVTAGYLMNSIELASRVKFILGVRFEATHLDTLSFDSSGTTPTPPTTLTIPAGGDYLSVLPSASLRFALDKDSDLRLVYGRGLSRPDPQDVTSAVSQIVKGPPDTFSLGNPNLKAENANDYDILYERYLNPLGLIQAGYFYKQLYDPIVTKQTITSSSPYDPGNLAIVTQPLNAGSAHVQGIEVGIQQRMSYLPSIMGGFGLSANYSYTKSQAYGVDPLRTDSPALLRQAPNTWNISPTYDTKHFSMRVGMTFDDKMIYAYQYENLAYATDSGGNPIIVNGVQQTTPNPQVGGTAGPAGDNYLYSHFQFDTQANYKLPWGFSIYGYGLNLNNEVFGFYNGGPQYVVQREYYHPTYAGGIRWDLRHE